MKTKNLVLLLCAVVWCLWGSFAWGAGFLVFEQGAKAMGMAGAFTATADDPSAIFNNPAGITQLSGTHVSIGNTFIRNDQKYDVDSASTPGLSYHEEMASRTFFLPHLYLTHEMNDRLTLGFGYYTPFGIGTDWADSSVGNSVANEAHIKTYDFNPNLACKVNPKLSLAMGVHYLRLKTQIIRQVGLSDFAPSSFTPVKSYETFEATGQSADQLGRLKLDGRGGGWAYNLGLLYKINEFWKAGFSYRSNMKVEVSRSESTVDWSPSGNAFPLVPVQLVSSHTYGYTKIGLPGIFLAGVSTTMFDKWNIDFDVQYTTWNHFDDLVVKMEPGLSYTVSGFPAASSKLVLQEDWENGWGFHLGTEYHYTDNFAVRTGYFYDKNPIPDRTLGAILPDSDRHNFSLGCGYSRGDWTLDAAYIYSHFENRSTDNNYQNFNASYKSDFHLLGVTLTRKM